jgi:hypothetical protein
VEIRWIENLEVGGTWEAFRIAGEDLGLDITPQDAEDQDRLDRAQKDPKYNRRNPHNTNKYPISR